MKRRGTWKRPISVCPPSPNLVYRYCVEDCVKAGKGAAPYSEEGIKALCEKACEPVTDENLKKADDTVKAELERLEREAAEKMKRIIEEADAKGKHAKR